MVNILLKRKKIFDFWYVVLKDFLILVESITGVPKSRNSGPEFF
jgi:hypothetical protein